MRFVNKSLLFGCLVIATLTFSLGQPPQAAKVGLGSRTAKAGFANETEIAWKFDNWRSDEDAKAWLKVMSYDVAEIESVAATKPHGEKADVQVRIKTSKGEKVEGISIKLVSNATGFNQIDKRWLANYAKMWKMPPDVFASLKLFVGEAKPNAGSKNTERMFLNELDSDAQKRTVAFFVENKAPIVSDIFEGDGPFAARWLMVALKSASKPKWILVSSSDAAKFFSEGPVVITRNGNLRIGRITMQRKGGDGGRETAKMLQFKINPALLFDAR